MIRELPLGETKYGEKVVSSQGDHLDSDDKVQSSPVPHGTTTHSATSPPVSVQCTACIKSQYRPGAHVQIEKTVPTCRYSCCIS